MSKSWSVALDNAAHTLSGLGMQLAVTCCCAVRRGKATICDCPACRGLEMQRSVAARLLWHLTRFWSSLLTPVQYEVTLLPLLGYLQTVGQTLLLRTTWLKIDTWTALWIAHFCWPDALPVLTDLPSVLSEILSHIIVKYFHIIYWNPLTHCNEIFSQHILKSSHLCEIIKHIKLGNFFSVSTNHEFYFQMWRHFRFGKQHFC